MATNKFKAKAPKKKRTNIKLNSLERAVMRTLAYRATFKYPVTFYQLSTYLLTKKKIKPNELRRVLERLVKLGLVNERRKKFILNGVVPVNWSRRRKNSDELLRKCGRIVKTLSKIKWIKFIGVTGAIAAGNSDRDDDIDVFIITRKGRLWLTRGFVVLLLILMGEYRRDSDPKRKVCPNIYMDEGSLTWGKSGRSLYVAHDLLFMVPMVDRENTYFRFIKKNDWVFDYFGHLKLEDYKTSTKRVSKSYFVDFLETVGMWAQSMFMRKKKTSEVTNRKLIHFNRGDHTKWILRGFEENCEFFGGLGGNRTRE